MRPAIKNLFEYRLGGGRRFSFWYDPWCGGQAIVERFPDVYVADSGVNRKAVVKNLWRNGRWVFPIPLNCNIQSVWDYVARNFVLVENCSDNILWKPRKDDNFSVASACSAMLQQRQKVGWSKLVWFRSNLPKHSFILWLAFLDRLHTRDRLCKWNVTTSDTCFFCNNGREEISHIFSCKFSNKVWRKVLYAINVSREPVQWNREISWFQRKAGGNTTF